MAAGVAGLFALSLLGASPEIELSYSDLEKLIRAAGAPAPDAGDTAAATAAYTAASPAASSADVASSRKATAGRAAPHGGVQIT